MSTRHRYQIILENTGGELDRRTARTEAECKQAVIDLVEDLAYFSDGDRIRIVDRAAES